MSFFVVGILNFLFSDAFPQFSNNFTRHVKSGRGLTLESQGKRAPSSINLIFAMIAFAISVSFEGALKTVTLAVVR